MTKTTKFKRDWSRTKHRLTCSPRALAHEILDELKCGSAAIMRYYEEHGYVNEDESVKDLIVRVVLAHVVFGEEPDENQSQPLTGEEK